MRSQPNATEWKMPRLKTEIDLDQLRALAALFCTVNEAAAFLGVPLATLDRRIKTDEAVRDAWLTGIENGKTSLRRKQFVLADKSAGMAIFLGKNYLGQTDVLVQERREAPPVPPMDLSKCTPEELAVLEGIARRNQQEQEAARIAADAQEANGETRH